MAARHGMSPGGSKARGGFRPIALFAAVYRLWVRCRSIEAKAWSLAHDRPYFACGAARSACAAYHGLAAVVRRMEARLAYSALPAARSAAPAWAVGLQGGIETERTRAWT